MLDYRINDELLLCESDDTVPVKCLQEWYDRKLQIFIGHHPHNHVDVFGLLTTNNDNNNNYNDNNNDNDAATTTTTATIVVVVVVLDLVVVIVVTIDVVVAWASTVSLFPS